MEIVQYSHNSVKLSDLTIVKYVAPKGSVLGPLLFFLYMLPLGDIIRKHAISFICFLYTDGYLSETTFFYNVHKLYHACEKLLK